MVIAAVLLTLVSAGVSSRAAAAEIDFKAIADAAVKEAEQRPAGSDKSSGASRYERDFELEYRDREWSHEFRRRSYEWHLLSTRIIFVLVVVIVGFGLFITYLQFSKDYTDSSYRRKPEESIDPKEAAGDPATPAAVTPSRSVTSLKLGPGGLELSSQIIGLAVLAFSLGFFYLYVKNVYPMHEESIAKVESMQEKPAASSAK